MKTDILVITALALEFKAVERLLTNPESLKNSIGSRYKRGSFATEQYDFSVAIVETGPGNVNAAQETERALSFFEPSYVFFVGVGGGMKDVGIGDVVVASEVIHYEGGKADDTYKPRLTLYHSNYELMGLAKQIARDASWQHRVVDGLGSYIAEVKPIAAGEKVVASERSATYELLKQSVSQAVAVEMEGYGFMAPVHSHNKKGIVIRGISDLLKDKAAADASGSQPLAARNATAFLAQILTELAKEVAQPESSAQTVAVPDTTQTTGNSAATSLLSNLAWCNQLASTLAKLYEAGPTESGGAWKRAGGKVAFLSNSSPVGAQWFAAVERLAKGGAGDVTLASLLAAAKEDFGSDPEIQRLYQAVISE